MGLDIRVGVDNEEQVFTGEYVNSELSSEHALSRSFCYLICEADAVGDDEDLLLEQLEKVSGVDLGIFAAMEVSPTPIHEVLTTLGSLIESLTKVGDLPATFAERDESPIDIASYFGDFSINKGDGYIGNNFGHDLRNLKRFLEYARSRGSQMVEFQYG